MQLVLASRGILRPYTHRRAQSHPLQQSYTQKGTEPPSTAESCLGEEICDSQQGPFAVLTMAVCLTLTPAESTQSVLPPPLQEQNLINVVDVYSCRKKRGTAFLWCPCCPSPDHTFAVSVWAACNTQPTRMTQLLDRAGNGSVGRQRLVEVHEYEASLVYYGGGGEWRENKESESEGKESANCSFDF